MPKQQHVDGRGLRWEIDLPLDETCFEMPVVIASRSKGHGALTQPNLLGKSIRAGLGLLARGALGALLATLGCGNLEGLDGLDGGDASVSGSFSDAGCLTSEQSCAGECVDLATSSEHCGECSNACSSDQTCDDGRCSARCSGGRVACDDGCVTVASDPKNCGECGKACDEGAICNAGHCVTSCDDAVCDTPSGTACADLQSNPSHCGFCDVECGLEHACIDGACKLECATPLTACDEQCVNTDTDVAHCGVCDHACPSGSDCVNGECSCANGETACGTECVALDTDSNHCGDCDVACDPDQLCNGGNCECPLGTELCDGVCIDPSSDAEHCGSCDLACGAGATCTAGLCIGNDGCFGPASELSISQIAVYQAVKIPIMEQLEPIAAASRNADLVVGRALVFRIFVDLDPGFEARELVARVRLHNPGGVQELTTRATPVDSSIDEEPESTFQMLIPAASITESTSYSVEIAECTDHVGSQRAPRFPTTGETPLEAKTTGPLKLHIVPVQVAGFAPDTSDTALSVYRDLLEAMYPITGVDLSVGPTLDEGDSFDWEQVLDDVRARRSSDAPARDIYYYGLVRSASTFRSYCPNSCVAGIGYVTSQNSASLRVATGVGYADQSSAFVMAHEIGHNHGRNHAPCGATAALDNGFPYDGAAVGVWGFDRRSSTFTFPTRKDIMSYCNPQWISDYTYQALLDRVVLLNTSVASSVSGVVRAIPEARFRVLLRGAKGLRWGHPYTGTPPGERRETAIIFDVAGRSIGTAEVYRVEIDGIDAELIAVPEPKPGWFSIQVPGLAAIPF